MNAERVPNHGSVSEYTNHRCRCAKCAEAHRIYYRGYFARIRSKPMPESVAHGTYNAYRNYRCRCDECKAANAAYGRDYSARTRARRTGEAS